MPTLAITLKTMKPLVIQGPCTVMRKAVYKTPEDMLAASLQLAGFITAQGGSIAHTVSQRECMTIETDAPTLEALRQTPELMQNIRHIEAIGGAPM